MNRKYFFLSCFLLLFCLPIPRDAAAGEQNVVARVADWRPAYWKNNDQWVGMDIDFYKALEKASGIPFTFVSLPWSRALYSIENGSCTIMTQLSRTPEREKHMYFLGPYNSEEMVLVVHKDNAAVPIRNFDEMAQAARTARLQIGIEKDAYYGDAFKRKMDADPGFVYQFQYAKTTLADMVSRKRLFGMLDQRVVIAHKINTMPQYKDLVVHDFIINSAPIYFGVTKKISPENLARLQRACDTLKNDGTFKQIETKWKKKEPGN